MEIGVLYAFVDYWGAELMAGSNYSYESDFYSWLSERVSPNQLSDIYEAFACVNEFCLQRRILTQTLFETDDSNVLKEVQHTIDQDRIFRFEHRRYLSKMPAGIRQYIDFLKTHRKSEIEVSSDIAAKAPEPQEENLTSPDPLIDLILDAKIEFIDHRDKGGALWILGAEENRPFVDKCAERGIIFYFKPEGSRTTGGAPAWWTKGKVKETPAVKSVADHSSGDPKERAKANRRAWIDWMKAQGLSSGTSMTSLSMLKQCGALAEKRGHLDRDIFLISSVAELDKLLAALNADQVFANSDKRQSGHYTEALQLFRSNLKAREQSAGEERGDIQPTSCAPDTEVAELLGDSIFDQLREALMKEHIYTIENLKKIKLWPFMNQHDLYTIATRQVVLTKVRELLAPIKQTSNGQLLRLHCDEAVYEGETASAAFLRYCENMARRFPLKIRTLLGKNLPGSSLVALNRAVIQGNPLKMENPTAFIKEDLTAEEVLRLAAWIGTACGCPSNDIRIEEPESASIMPEVLPQEPHKPISRVQELCIPGFASEKDVSSASTCENDNSNTDQMIIKRLESIVMQADMEGLSLDELRGKLREATAETRRLVAFAKHIVDIKGRLYHEDALVDWAEGADQLESIIDKLMQKNNGYISAAQLYKYAHADMNMFLNDNDMNDECSVYDMAQHLFEKNAYHGKQYSFSGKTHIAISSDVSTIFDVCCKFAEDQSGFFAFSDLIDYLTGVGLKTGNLRGQLKVYTKPDFLYYESGVLVLSKSLQINEEWLAAVRSALNRLFSDVGDHIILREIQPFWFEQLPSLPNSRPWTPLLLQSVLRFYGEELDARTIIAMETQSIDTLHTMLVQLDSPIQNFCDVVISYIVENGIEQRSFGAEELRQILVESRMIQGNELIGNMSKALGHDERFAWDAGGDHVTIKV